MNASVNSEQLAANQRQVGGDHYKTGGLEHWDLFGVEYLVGCATKYIARWRKKGTPMLDLEKGLHYAEKIKERRFQGTNVDDERLDAWIRNAKIDWPEATIIRMLMLGRTDVAIAGIQHLIATAKSAPPVRTLDVIATQQANKQKSYRDMTDDELSDEHLRLHAENETATGWGAAVGARHESIREIERERRRRRNAGVGIERFYPEKLKPLGPVPGDEDPTDSFIRDMMKDGPTIFPQRQRTPEDGGQHASVAPWVVGNDFFLGKEITFELADKFWTKRALNLHVLEPYVESEKLPRVLDTCYKIIVGPSHWILDIARCPPDARDYFPNLYHEKNMMEWEQLPAWQRALYQWNETGNKYELAPRHAAWHVEGE
jgi:hypothetical protein